MTAVAGRRPSPSRTTGYRRAVRRVARWAEFYTRELDPAIAGERRDELASDLWEEGADADARGRSGAATGLSILWRAARGIPADLSWRRRSLRQAPDRAPRAERWIVSGGLAAVCTLLLATSAFGLVALGRIGVAVARGEFLPSSTTLTSLLLGMVALVCGAALLRTRRTRWVAALWLAAASLAVLRFGALALFTLSATAQSLADPLNPVAPAGGPLVAAVGLGAITVFHVAIALAWMPTRHSGASARQEADS